MDIIRGEQLAEQYEELVERAAADERIIISHGGQQVALVSFSDLMMLEEIDRIQDQQDLEEIERRKNDPTYPFVPKTLKAEAAAK